MPWINGKWWYERDGIDLNRLRFNNMPNQDNTQENILVVDQNTLEVETRTIQSIASGILGNNGFDGNSSKWTAIAAGSLPGSGEFTLGNLNYASSAIINISSEDHSASSFTNWITQLDIGDRIMIRHASNAEDCAYYDVVQVPVPGFPGPPQAFVVDLAFIVRGTQLTFSVGDDYLIGYVKRGAIGPTGGIGLDGNSSIWVYGSSGNNGEFDTGTLSIPAITGLKINHVDTFSNNMQQWLAQHITIGDHITIREYGNPGVFGHYKVIFSSAGIATDVFDLQFISGTNPGSFVVGRQYVIGYVEDGPQGAQGAQGSESGVNMWYEAWKMTSQVSGTSGVALADSNTNNTTSHVTIYYHAWWNESTGDLTGTKIRVRQSAAVAQPATGTVHVGIYDNGGTLKAPRPGQLISTDTLNIGLGGLLDNEILEIPLQSSASVVRDRIYFIALATRIFNLANVIDYYGSDDSLDTNSSSWAWAQASFNITGGLPVDPFTLAIIPEVQDKGAYWFIVHGPQTVAGATQGPQGAAGVQGPQGDDGEKGLAGNSSLWAYNDGLPINNGTPGDFMISTNLSTPSPIPSWNPLPVGSATTIRVQLNSVDGFGTNMLNWINSINVGDIIYIREHTDNTNYAYYKVTNGPFSFASSGQVFEVDHIESNSVGNGSIWDGKRFNVGFIPAGPAGPQGSSGASAGTIAGLPYSRLATGAPDGWGSASVQSMPPNNEFLWYGPTDSPAPNSGPHPLAPGGTHASQIKRLMWLGPPSGFSTNVMIQPIKEVIDAAGGTVVQNITNPQLFNDAAWHVAPTSGKITGYAVNMLHGYNATIYYTTLQELPVFTGALSWTPQPAPALGYYEYNLTGSIVLRGGATGPAGTAGYEMFTLAPVPSPPGNNQNDSHQILFSKGDLLVAGIGFGKSTTGNPTVYPKDCLMSVTIYVEFD